MSKSTPKAAKIFLPNSLILFPVPCSFPHYPSIIGHIRSPLGGYTQNHGLSIQLQTALKLSQIPLPKRSHSQAQACRTTFAAHYSSIIAYRITQNAQDNTLGDTLARLARRLDEPFVTVNTVTGDVGIKKAQDEYEQLMKNKTPKSQR